VALGQKRISSFGWIFSEWTIPPKRTRNAEKFAEICTVADYVFVVAAAEGLLDFILRFVWFRKFFGF